MFCLLKGLEARALSIKEPNLVPRSSSLVKFSNKRNQGSLEYYLILKLEKRIYSMSLENDVLPESNQVLKKIKNKTHRMMGICQMDTGTN